MRVAFTGHREFSVKFFSDDDPLLIDLKKRISAEIEKTILDGADEFYSGMAIGTDMMAADEVLKLREKYPHIKLIAMIPCPNQCEKWGREHILQYTRIMEQCDKIMTISPEYTSGCMHKRDRALVDICDLLIAVYENRSGGTRYTVEYARKKGRKIIFVTV